MALQHAPVRDDRLVAGDAPKTTIDWERIARSPEFQELAHKRRRFVVPATLGFLAWYLGFIVLAGYAESFMGESVYRSITVGYVLALTQFVMVWGLGWAYLRYSRNVLDPLREKARAVTEQGVRTGRFEVGS